MSSVPRGSRRQRLELFLETAVIVAAVATVPIIILEQAHGPSVSLEIADWTLWLVFVIEYVVMLRLAEHPLQYVGRAWPALLVILLSFPLTPSIFGATRLATVGRLPRLLRLAAVSLRGLSALRVVFGRAAVVAIALLTAFIVIVAAAAITLLEPQIVGHDFGSAVWWAIVTTTTVGYGDIVPVTLGGRLAAIILMLTGIGLVSTLSASIVAYFMEQGGRGEFTRLERRLDRIEQMLTTLTAKLEQRSDDDRSPRR